MYQQRQSMSMKIPLLLLSLQHLPAGTRASSWTIDELYETANNLEYNLDVNNFGECDPGAVVQLLIGADANCAAFKAMNDAFDYMENRFDDAVDLVFQNTKGGNIDVDDFPDGLQSITPDDDVDGNEYHCEVSAYAVGDGEDIVYPEIGRTSDRNCLSEKMREVQRLRNGFNVEPYVEEQCNEETTAIESASTIMSAYSRIEAHSEVIKVNDTYSVLFLNYTESNTTEMMAAYESACLATRGYYEQLDFEADCYEKDSAGETIFHEYLHVIGLPRCYGMNCSVFNFDDSLFEKYTLQATEVRNRDATHGETWTCSGSLFAYGFSSATSSTTTIEDVVCEVQNDALEQSVTLVDSMNDIDSTIKTAAESMNIWEKFVAIFDISNDPIYRTVTFNDVIAYETACTENSGINNAVQASSFCKKMSTSTNKIMEESVLDTTGFPTCIGQQCANDDPDVSYDNEFAQYLVQHDDMSEEGMAWNCEPSSAFVVIYHPGALIPWVVASFWYLIIS